MGVVRDRSRPSIRATYGRIAERPAWTVCALLVVGSVFRPIVGFSVPRWLGFLPLLASAVVFGLPHGAIDYLVPARIAGASRTRSALVVGLLYAVVGGAYAALWFRAPVLAAVLFIAVTWFHWGQGDVHALVTFADGSHLDARPLRVATGAVRGGLPMLVPLLAFPDRYRAVVSTWVGLFGRDLSAPWLFAPETRAVAGGAFVAVTLVVLALGYQQGGWTRGWRVDAGETVLLWVYFLTVPPLVAIGVYFCVWHSLRHILRYVAVGEDGRGQPVGEVAEGSGHGVSRRVVRDVFVRFAREAAPLTGLALLFLVGFGLAIPGSLRSIEAVAGLYLVFVAVLTLPHVVVVTWMDRQEGIWHG